MHTDGNIPAVPEKGFYYHYKHDPKGDLYNYIYEVVGVGRNTEEKTLTVLYRPLYESDWMRPVDYQSRPLPMFMENLMKDGVEVPRFTKITDPELIKKLEIIRDEMYA
jgi:hypothetical protein